MAIVQQTKMIANDILFIVFDKSLLVAKTY
jgi:hypothetical protein